MMLVPVASLSQFRPKQKHTPIQFFFYVGLFVGVIGSALAEEQGLSADANDAFEEPEIRSSETPESLFQRSYLVLPRQRLTYYQRQAGKAVYLLGAESAVCSSLTGPDCLYRPVLANPNDASEQVPADWKLDESNFKVTFMVVKSGTKKTIQELLTKGMKKDQEGAVEQGTGKAVDTAAGAGAELDKVFFHADQSSVPDLDRMLDVVAESVGWGPEEAEALKPKLARLLAEVELAGANLSKTGRSKDGSSSDESGEGVSADSAAEDSKEVTRNTEGAADGVESRQKASVVKTTAEDRQDVQPQRRRGAERRGRQEGDRSGRQAGQDPTALGPMQEPGRQTRGVVTRGNAAWSDPFGFGGAVASAALGMQVASAESGEPETGSANRQARNRESQTCGDDGTCGLEEGDSSPKVLPGPEQELGSQLPKQGSDAGVDLADVKVDPTSEGSRKRADFADAPTVVEATGPTRLEPLDKAQQGLVGGHSGVKSSEAGDGALAQNMDFRVPGSGDFIPGDGKFLGFQAAEHGLRQSKDVQDQSMAGKGFKQSSAFQDQGFDLVDEDDYDMEAELDNMPDEWLDEYAEHIYNITGGLYAYDDGYDEDY